MGEYQVSWDPTPEQFKAYVEREVALCKALLRKDPTIRQYQTLYPMSIWERAHRELGVKV